VSGSVRASGEQGSFHGLFYGVEDYRHPGISRLGFAHRDAEVMFEIFNGASPKNRLAMGSEVTKDRIRSDLNDLKMSCRPEDQVVIYFSGHGARSSHLVTHDADPGNLGATSIALGELHEAMTRITARSVLILLDCCFAGSDPAKVVYAPLNARNGAPPSSTEECLANVLGPGRGRALITASVADQQAWESDLYQHGVFTHHLVQALVGEPGTVVGGKLSLARIWDHLKTSVAEDRHLYGRAPQIPTLYGALAPDILLPRTAPSPRLSQLWTERTLPPPAGRAPESLLDHGIRPEIVKAWSGAGLEELKPLQVEAVNEQGVMVGSSLLVDAPTSSGKNLIGEFAALRAVAAGGRAVFLLPSRALVSEQYGRYSEIYGGAGLTVVRAVGGVDAQTRDIVAGRYDLAVLTYEKFAALLRRTDLADGVATVVVDEVHNLADRDRGPALELLLTRLLSAPRRSPLQIVGLSAVLGAGHHLDTWLRARLHRSIERPVPLHLAVLSPEGSYRYLDERRDDYEDARYLPPAADSDALLLEFVRKAVADGEKVLLFRGSRYSVMQQAEALAGVLGRAASERTLTELDTADAGGITDRLKRCLRHGVAFHTAALSEHQRAVLETSFRSREDIRVIVSTTTLSQGVNLPADTVVVTDFENHHGRSGRYSVAQFHNIAGRAGRTGLGAARGRAVIVAESAEDARRKWDDYVLARPERLCSALSAPDRKLHDLLLAVCANVPAIGARRIPVARITDFLSRTWAAHQAYRSLERDPFPEREVETAIDYLATLGLLEHRRPDIVLSRLGTIAVQDHLRAESVRTLADVLDEAGPERLNAQTLVAALQVIDELDAIWLPGVSRGKAARRALDTYQEILARHNVAHSVRARMISGEDPLIGLSRARRTVACLEWASGSPIATLERAVARCIPAPRDADPGPLFQVIERTADFIGSSVSIAKTVCPSLEDAPVMPAWRRVSRLLPVRMEQGLNSGLAEVALLADVTVPREVYLKLHAAGLSDKHALLGAGTSGVRACLGEEHESHAEVLLTAAEDAVQDEEGHREAMDDFQVFM
jgi:replicative superfamily II helicase